jgi:hypothetical protein
MPEGLLYKSYLAGPKEPRFATSWVHDRSRGWLWDVTLGGRVGILRFGSETHPEGFQLDIEGAAFPRLDIEHQRDLESADFRFGVPLTWADGPFQLKFAYYHLSSHVGDEYLVRNPGFVRSNYSRDALVLGGGYFLTPDLRLYGELDYAFVVSGGSQPWMIQFGADYSPVAPVRWHGAPFVAINGLLRQEVSWGGGFNLMAGWQWRSLPFGRLVRIGLQYYNGKTSQFEFLQASDEMLGMGFWYDY